MTLRPHHPLRRGLSLVELLVGMAIGLFVVAAATVMVSGQLGENRRLLLESQLQQDLRAAADIITRELRRAGGVIQAQDLVATGTAAAAPNTFTAVTPASGPSNPADVTFKYERTALAQGPWGFKLDNGVIKTRVVQSATGAVLGWQDLTDGAVMEVTQFVVTVNRQPAAQIPCPRLCPGGGTDCWPVIHVRDFVVQIGARLRAAPEVQRTLRAQVRARNDWVEFRASGNPPPACPT